jgi:hypothetical protein
MGHVERACQEGTLDFAELLDATRATAAVNTTDLRRLVRHLRELARQGPVGPTAVVVGDDLTFGIVRMLGTLSQDFFAVRPFCSRAEAEAWLDEVAAQPSG